MPPGSVLLKKWQWHLSLINMMTKLITWAWTRGPAYFEIVALVFLVTVGAALLGNT